MNIAVLLAAGKSERFGSDKLLMELGGEPIVASALEFLEGSTTVNEIYVAVNTKNKAEIAALVKVKGFKKVKGIFLGGNSRFESVKKILEKIFSRLKNARYLIIHNAANPLASEEELEKCFKAFEKGISGVGVARKITSTLRKFDGNICETVPRENIWEMETPQVVHAKDFINACKTCGEKEFTDDLAVLECAGKKTRLVKAAAINRKITAREDFEMMNGLYGNFSVGIGEDSHKIGKNGTLTLGGIKIAGTSAAVADSDGDVIIHSLINALSSAIGGGSLGTIADKLCARGIKDSREYLKTILKEVKKRGYEIYNCSFSLEAKRPHIDSLALRLKKSLSLLLCVDVSRVGITATSGQNLTPFGKGEALKCTACVLLRAV